MLQQLENGPLMSHLTRGIVGAALVEMELRRPGALTAEQYLLARQASDRKPKALQRLLEMMICTH